ncbi:hypothetical protein N7507_004309 [Penicillium longicatenatum]|nr:hypothetical protein N7507_004309 [Penicillium longicatenatum]
MKEKVDLGFGTFESGERHTTVWPVLYTSIHVDHCGCLYEGDAEDPRNLSAGQHQDILVIMRERRG